MQRTELLDKLYSVRELFDRIFYEKDNLDNICASYEEAQDEIGTSTFVDKGRILLTGAIVAYGLVLLLRMQIPFLVCLIAYLICRINGNTYGLVYNILNIIFMFQGVYLIYACVTSPNLIPAFAVLFGVAGIICAIIIRAKNKSVRRNNARIEKKNWALFMQYREQMEYYNHYQLQLAELTRGWFPPNYLTYDCVNFFIDALENWRADNLKELVNLYAQEMHNRRMEEMQNSVVRQQQLSNVFHLLEIGMHAYSHAAIQSKLSSIEANTARTASSMESIAYRTY